MFWARVVLKQPAGGSREAEATFRPDLHPHLDHVPADTGESAPQAAHVKVVDDTSDTTSDAIADRPQDERTTTTDRGDGTASTSDPTGRQPDLTVRRDR